MVLISVIVPAKNEENCIEHCLKRLANQKVRPEIIVVDGHSADRTRSIAKKYADKIILDRKKGISDARNLGFRAASGSIVAYCDADSRPSANWTKNILRLMRDNICISGPLFCKGSMKTKYSMRIWINWFPRFTAYLNYPLICGPNMAFRKEILEQNPFRGKILEDFELGNRLRKKGKIKFCKELQMPISGRRYEKKFYRMCLKYYIPNYIRILLGKETKEKDYWNN